MTHKALQPMGSLQPAQCALTSCGCHDWARGGRKMPRRDGRSRLLSEEASPAAMELVARALDGTPTADEFGRPWVGSVAEMPDEFAADSASLAKARAFAEARRSLAC